MAHLESTRENKSFAERIRILTNYISPLRQMWPYYWLKAAAVRDPESTTWKLHYFSMIGRWNESKPAHEVCDRGKTIVAISQMIDATKAWEILRSLQTNGTVILLPDVIARAKPNPDMTQPTVSYWQESVPFPLSKAIAEVTEVADWRYLFLSEHRSASFGVFLLDDDEDLDARRRREAEELMKRTLQDELDDRALPDFALFTSTRLGLGYGGSELGCSLDDFFYQFDFPLALRIDRGIPDRATNTLPLTIYCRRPLMLESLKISRGDTWASTSQPLTIQIECSSEQEWSVGNVIVPYNCGKISLQFEHLTRTLMYEIPTPTHEDQVVEIVGHIYSRVSSGKGKEKWEKHLLDELGGNFEIALLNALSRLGIPTLFAGQLQASGSATPGYDLAALNHTHRRAVLISAKGSANNPSQEDCQKLLDAVEAIQRLLPEWYVTGILACHATNNKLGLAKKRTDLRIWSREDLEWLCQADKREAIDHLLWTPPGASTLLDRILRGRNS